MKRSNTYFRVTENKNRLLNAIGFASLTDRYKNTYVVDKKNIIDIDESKNHFGLMIKTKSDISSYNNVEIIENITYHEMCDKFKSLNNDMVQIILFVYHLGDVLKLKASDIELPD